MPVYFGVGWRKGLAAMSTTEVRAQMRQFDDNPDQWIAVSCNDGKAVKEFLEARHGNFVAERTITNAIRRRQLRFQQVGQQRYTTPRFLDEWLASVTR